MQRFCPVVVGRSAELALIRESLAEVSDGRGRSIMLLGEPGIGKSRLAREALSLAEQQGMVVARGRATPSSESAAYRPLTEALMQLFRNRPLPDNDDLAGWLPILHPLLPVRVTGTMPSSEVPPNVRGEALVQLLSHMSATGIALVFEDLHWADPDTIAIVEYLADNLSELPVLLISTIRDGLESAALEMAIRSRVRPGSLHLALGRLDPEELEEMIRACEPSATPEVVSRVTGLSEGVPLFVEDLLSSPDLPTGFVAAVRVRLAAMPPEQCTVIEAAAIVGRDFDWQLLPSIAGQPEEVVTEALEAGMGASLLVSHGSVMRFRHALTRDAVLESMTAPRQRDIARRAIAVLTDADGPLERDQRDLVIDLALRAGERRRAGLLLAASGRESLLWGALTTATDTLRRAVDLLSGSSEQSEAELDLVETLALAGRVDEAASTGGILISRISGNPRLAKICIEAHLRLAQAGIAASRRQMTHHHLDEARRLMNSSAPERVQLARLSVLQADVTVADGDHDRARLLAEEALGMEGATPDILCHAYEVIGRCMRSTDLVQASTAFTNALITAEAANLAHWRMRALHELGTIDLFDHVGVERLLQAREAAEKMGALGIAAILDLQLSAAFTCRWDLAACDRHATAAIAIAEHLGLKQVRAKALGMLTGSASMRADQVETDRFAAQTIAADTDNQMLESFCWGMRGMARLLSGDDEGALPQYAKGMEILANLPNAEPAAFRALWPLVLAARGDRRTQEAIDEARRLGVAAFNLNRAMIIYAEAVLAGRNGDSRRATELVVSADTLWTNCEVWADLCRALAAPAVAAGTWVDLEVWLEGVPGRLAGIGLDAISRRCIDLLANTKVNPWAEAGISSREADVLRLLSDGKPNREIADELHISRRTVEKHVESLLRKAGARTRTELVALLVVPDSVLKPQPPGST